MSDPAKAVFLSYARDDAAAARRIAEALRAAGCEMWFDEHELRGGDAWDAQIRQKIRECALFVPVISVQTQARAEGYFRREWKLADHRTEDMGRRRAFLVPVCIDDTKDGEADVPDSFLRVQWTRLPGGLPTPQFVAQVKRLLESPAAPTARAEAAAATPRKSVPPVALAIALGVVAVSVGLVFFVAGRQKPEAPAATPAKPAAPVTAAKPAIEADKSIAVLAFADLSEKRDSTYFSDGISEELLNVLAKIPDLRVAARTSAFFFKDKNLPIPEIAQKLNVAYVVEGSVQRAGGRVKITAQLIKASDGFHVWSDTFTRDLKDVFAVQEEIAALIATSLSLKLGIAAATAVPTKNLAAYDAYLRARAAQSLGSSEILTLDAIRYYEEAVRLDPDYALAWARLAQVRARIVGGGFDRSAANVAQARTAIANAVRLNANLPEVHLAQSLISQHLDGDLAAAARALDLAEKLRPGDAELPAGRVRVAYARGESGAALAALVDRAVEADPQNAANLGWLGSTLSDGGLFAAADRLIRIAIVLSPTNESLIRSQAINLARWTGDVGRAIALLETTPEEARGRNRFYSTRASWREELGDLAGALADHARACAVMRENYYDRSGPRTVLVSSLFHQSRLEEALGRTARAARLLDEAEAEQQKINRDFPGQDTSRFNFVRILVRRGRVAEALAESEAMVGRAEATHNLPNIRGQRLNRAAALILLGRKDEALAVLRQLMDTGTYFPGYGLRRDLDFERLRDDPHFRKICAEAEARADAQTSPPK